jgi:hypothetical protein
VKKWRDPRQYREEAARCREQAAATLDSAQLRDSYLALAIQYERMADVLDQGEAARPDPRAQKLEAVDKLRDLAEQNIDIGTDIRRLADQLDGTDQCEKKQTRIGSSTLTARRYGRAMRSRRLLWISSRYNAVPHVHA